MTVYLAQIEHCPIQDGANWFPSCDPTQVNATDIVWAAFKVCRERRLQPGRDRVVIDGRRFHPGSVN